MVDYQVLLKKYMARVIASESVSYVDTHVGMGEREPDEEEMAELERIERELRAEGLR